MPTMFREPLASTRAVALLMILLAGAPDWLKSRVRVPPLTALIVAFEARYSPALVAAEVTVSVPAHWRPSVVDTLRIAGAGYLLYLAARIATAGDPSGDAAARKPLPKLHDGFDQRILVVGKRKAGEILRLGAPLRDQQRRLAAHLRINRLRRPDTPIGNEAREKKQKPGHRYQRSSRSSIRPNKP